MQREHDTEHQALLRHLGCTARTWAPRMAASQPARPRSQARGLCRQACCPLTVSTVVSARSRLGSAAQASPAVSRVTWTAAFSKPMPQPRKKSGATASSSNIAHAQGRARFVCSERRGSVGPCIQLGQPARTIPWDTRTVKVALPPLAVSYDGEGDNTQRASLPDMTPTLTGPVPQTTS